MYESFNIITPSPNGLYTAKLEFSGEIRFGPAYYSLSINDYSFGQRIFGAAHCWSLSSTMLALQEWLTLDYTEGPITVMLLIDIALKREIALVKTIKGFTIPESFQDATLIYHQEFAGRATQPVTIDTNTITEWVALN